MPQGPLSRVCLGLAARPVAAGIRAAGALKRSRFSGAIRRAVEAATGFVRELCSQLDNAASNLPLIAKPWIAVSLPAVAIDALEPRQLLSTTFFVATNGSDTNAGTIGAPFLTIQHAASIAQPGDTVDIRGGTYHQTVTPASSGAPGAPITFQSYNGENVIIDGADPVTGWSNYSGSIYQANDPTDLGFGNNQVFVNGKAVNLATWPNIGLELSHPQLATVQGGGGSLTDNALLTSGVDWTGGTVHIISGQQWVSQTATITSDSGNRITFNLGYTPDPHGGIQPGDKYYLTGKLGALSSPGQFFLGSGGSLYLWTPDSSNPNYDDVEVKDRLYGFDLNGKSNINIQGINLFACSIIANGSNNININKISAEYVSQFTVLGNGWNTPNNTGIVLNGSNNSITNSVIAYSAGDGILALGYNNTIENNTVHDCDYSATDCAGVRTWGGDDNISYNTIYNCGRDGIKFSNTTDTQVAHNLVYDVMLQTTDGGGIYTYGTNGSGSQIAYNQCFNIHSGGWGAAGLYLDNDSSNYSVHNNDVYDVDIGLKCNPTSYNEKIVDNTLLADMQSVGSSGTQDMSGSEFIDNVFNATVMIKGSVQMSGNVSSGNTAGAFAVGATIGASIPAFSSTQKKTVAIPANSSSGSALPPAISNAKTSGGATPPVTVATVRPGVMPEVGSAVGPFPFFAVKADSNPAQNLQAVDAQLATDRKAFVSGMRAVAASTRATDLADFHLVSADKAQIIHDLHDKTTLATARADLAAARLKLHDAVAAGREVLALDKAGLLDRIKQDVMQKLADTRLMPAVNTDTVKTKK
jgi:hypothetical protein